MKGYWPKVTVMAIALLLALSLFIVPEVVEADEETNPVVCVHGYTGSGRNYRTIESFLQDEGWDYTSAITYNSPSDPRANEDNAQQLSDFIDDVMDDTGSDEVDIIAHSMGGLSSRYYLQELDGHENVGTIITLGTPHDGVLLGPGDLSRFSSFLRSLNRGDVTPGDVYYVSIYGTRDSLVTESSAHMDEWDKNIEVRGVDHFDLLDDDEVLDHIKNNLTGAPDDDDDDDDDDDPWWRWWR